VQAKISIENLRNRREKLNKGSVFYLFLKLIQINYIFSGNDDDDGFFNVLDNPLVSHRQFPTIYMASLLSLLEISDLQVQAKISIENSLLSKLPYETIYIVGNCLCETKGLSRNGKKRQSADVKEYIHENSFCKI
jgi:hypothetical protein